MMFSLARQKDKRMDSLTSPELYRKKDLVEKTFSNLKEGLNMKRREWKWRDYLRTTPCKGPWTSWTSLNVFNTWGRSSL